MGAYEEWQRSKGIVDPKKKKDFWTDQISTGGGIGGSLAGAAGGAALGSVVPGIGTAIGGLLGAVLGGGLGSAGGQVAENKIAGDSLDKDVLQEGLIGGVTSLPIGAGFKLARAGLKAGTGLGKTSASELIQQAGNSVVPRALSGGAGQAATSAADPTGMSKFLNRQGDKLISSQANITRAQARQLGTDPTTVMGNVNNRTGLTNLDDMAEVGRTLTGRQGSLLDAMTRGAVEEAPGVNIGDLRSTAQGVLDDRGSLLGTEARKNILGNAQRASVTMRGGSQGSLDPLANPGKALDQANVFRTNARTLKSNPLTLTPEGKQKSDVYNAIAKNMEDAIYAAPGVGSSIPSIARAGRDDLLFLAQDARAAGNSAAATAYEKLAQEVAGITDIKQLRSMKKDFVNVSKIDEATAQAANGAGQQFGDQMVGAGRLAKSPMNLIALPLNAASGKIGGALKSASTRLEGGAPTQAAGNPLGQNLLGLTARQGIGRAVVPGEEEPADAMIDPTQLGQMDQSQLGGMEDIPVESTGIDRNLIMQAMVQDLAQTGGKNIDVLQSVYEFSNPQIDQKVSSQAAKAQMQAANGISTLDQLDALLGRAGGGSGFLGGTLANVLGNANINNDAKTYNDLARGSVAQIAKAMGESGALSDSDIATYSTMLPKLTDTPQVAQAKMAALRERLAAAAQNTSFYQGATDSPFDYMN